MRKSGFIPESPSTTEPSTAQSTALQEAAHFLASWANLESSTQHLISKIIEVDKRLSPAIRAALSALLNSIDC